MSVLDWDPDATNTDARIVACEDFSARGLQRVYGRSDVPSAMSARLHRPVLQGAFNMDIWLRRDGRIFVRFWSRRSEVDRESYEVVGVDLASIPARDLARELDERWIPPALRIAYEDWFVANLPFA